MSERATAARLQLAAIEKPLRELLALLADGDAQPERIERLWQACKRQEAGLTLVAPDGASPQERDELAAHLAQLCSLNAVAVQELVHQRGALAQALERTRKARVHLAARAPSADLGASCDIAG